MTGYQDIYIQLSGNRAQRIQVTGGHTLVAVYDPDPYWSMSHRDGKGQRTLIHSRQLSY